MRNHPTDRDAPKPIEPPTGALEVYTYDPKTGIAELRLACGDDAGRAIRAVTAMRRAEGIACYARGGVVCGVKYGTPPSLVAPMKAAVKAAHADRSNDRTHALAPDGALCNAASTAEGQKRASSGASDGATTSSRSTLRRPAAWVEGATPVRSSSFRRAA
mgnify:CR=1 FL=1